MPYYNVDDQLPCKARIYPFQHGFLYTSISAVASYTKRHPAVVLVSLDGAEIGIRTETGYKSGRALAIAPQVKRLIEADGVGFAALHVEPSHHMFRSFMHMQQPDGVEALPYDQFTSYLDGLNTCYSQAIEIEKAERLFSQVLGTICSTLGQAPTRDKRIERLLDWLTVHSPLDYSFERLKGLAGLSEGRLSHLFTGEVGLSLRSFLMWRKTREAISLINTDMNLTDIAHASGFADSAHFSRTFSNSLGVLPSMMRDDSCVQVIGCAA